MCSFTYERRIIMFYIEIEGIESAGKTTQCALLDMKLSEMGIPSLVAKELETTMLGQEIKKILLSNKPLATDPLTELFLFLGCKTHHFRSKVIPALQNKTIVIGDRGNGSFLTYHAETLPQELLLKLLEKATNGVNPAITFLIDIPVDTVPQRIYGKKTQSRFDLQTLEKLDLKRQLFLAIAGKNNNWKIINGTQNVSTIHSQIWEETKSIIL